MVPDLPGGTGLLSYLGTVQPQLAEAELITRSASPVFVYEKMQPTFSPSFTVPKLCSGVLKVSTAVPVVSVAVFLPSPELLLQQAPVRKAAAARHAIRNVKVFFILFLLFTDESSACFFHNTAGPHLLNDLVKDSVHKSTAFGSAVLFGDFNIFIESDLYRHLRELNKLSYS